jgi:glycyl-tRNA synthetase
MSEKLLNFQDIILRLNSFWSEHGCLLWQPHSEKVGAGTMNPATVLRVLGPEPWNVGYVEPSFRPDDGRYGENPNRMQMHTQYQVILKPDPGNPQELYLDSLEALGIDRTRHDIRFVEDNWESPALGAWGLGWEVWLDGLEITQFTYFQQAASQVLDLPAVEITYGLERIAMYLHGVRQVWDLPWDQRRTYRDVLLDPEVDHCRYNFEHADVDRLLDLYRLYEEEAKAAIAAGVVAPAHDYVLRCSHTFNILDSRGTIGVTDRASYFARMRDLSRQVAELYLAQRKEAGFPWLSDGPADSPSDAVPLGPALTEAADLLVEVGTEELPPQDVRTALEQLSSAIPAWLQENHLLHKMVRVSGTPRRLVVVVEGLAARQEDMSVEIRGPAVSQAYDADGKPTKAALGFARGKGVDVADLQVRGEGKKQYVVAVKIEEGRDTGELLLEAIPQFISDIRFDKSMRWNGAGTAFSRPIRWLLALHGDRVLPFSFAGLTAERTTRGLRHVGTGDIPVKAADDYAAVIARNQIALDRTQRRETIWRRIGSVAGEVQGVVPPDDVLLDEVTDLVECPVVLLGHFDEEYLQLPQDVLITVMKKHQRYFPVVGPDGQLRPHFAVVVNGEGRDEDVVRRGNEDVLRARYADAAYFVNQDRKHSLEAFVTRLDQLVYYDKLGSMLQKQRRVEQLIGKLSDTLGLSKQEAQSARRAAALCKADLATSMVTEMTSLQGIMGREYALASGEPEPVAMAILDHYLPRFAGDRSPKTRPGIAVGLADRFDSLAGLFGAGVRATSGADPFGLRRTAVGLIQILLDADLSLSLRDHLAAAGDGQPIEVGRESLEDASKFLLTRLEVRLREQGLPAEVTVAALAEQGDDPALCRQGAVQLAEAVQAEDWIDVLTAYARCKRIVKNLEGTLPLSPSHYTEPATKELVAAVQKADKQLQADRSVTQLVKVLRDLQDPVNRFFDDILVMAKQPEVRDARLALVQRVAQLPDGLADLSLLPGF